LRKRALAGLLLTQIIMVCGFWSWDHVHVKGAAEVLLAVGRLAGLGAAFGILFQLVLIGRSKWVEQGFGLDRLVRVHQTNGLLVIGALIAHPILVTAGHAMRERVSLWVQLKDFFAGWDAVPLAAAGWLLFLALGAFSIAPVRRRIRYERWYATHLAAYAAIVLAFFHQTRLGRDFTKNRIFAAYWFGVHACVAASLVFFRFLTPALLFWRHRFAVDRLERETDDVVSVVIRGRNLAAFRFRAGQFMFVRFWAEQFWWQSHPFSMSRPADGNEIRLSIKRVGDFTASIPKLAPGTPVLIDGPHGVFTATQCRSRKVLMIAAGIGITPIRSLGEELTAGGREVLILYGNRTRTAIVFREELDELEAIYPAFKVIHVLSHDPSWAGEKGRIDAGKIRRLASDAAERDVFLCGPPSMMKDVLKALAMLKVPRSAIHWERFSL
jgi:predicted ferric reductase